MAQAGASIEAFLKLDASEFKSGMDGVKESVKTFKSSFEGLEKESKESIGKVLNDIKTLKESFAEIGRDSILARDGFQAVQQAINSLNESIVILKNSTKEVQNFKTLAQGMNQAAEAAQRLTTVAERGGMGIEALNSILATWRAGMESVTINVNGLSNSLRSLNNVETQTSSSTYSVASAFEQAKAELMGMQTGLYRTGAVMSDAEGKAIYHAQQLREQMKMMKAEFNSARSDLMALANGGAEAFNKILTGVNRVNTTLNSSMNAINMYRVALQGIGTTASSLSTSFANVDTSLSTYTSRIGNSTLNTNLQTSAMEKLSLTTSNTSTQFTKLSAEELKEATAKQRETTITNQSSSAHQRNASSMSQASARANQLTSATNRLSKAMSSLRMMGSLVGSMLAYNFAHKLLVATGETIHAKSEMEGYFKMLNFGQADIDHFNKALDNTVSQFQRVNKYSLGETISSIGVEFNLTTQEMEKAMKVTSMITSEYLRAGRNANEASLAVKDVLQGQFQRLSRETGVKGEDLKKAGWSGDTSDVLGLMEALEKVGQSRNWDVFAEKANSLNDILTILQNRFGEWSADMVYSVQPMIVGAFNAIMDVAGMFAQSLTGVWEWLNGGSWEAIGTQFTTLAIGIGVVSQALVMYRANIGLVEASQLGLKNSITALVFGLKGQEMAEIGVRNSIMAKILGVKAETLAESGLARAISERTTMTQLEAVQEQLNTLSSKENSLAKMENAIQSDINKAKLEGLITAEEADTLRKELNTAMTEANALASLKQAGVNGTLTTTFIALGGAENITAVATGELSVAMGVLNGVFALSPIGWVTAGILALAGAIYVLTGGLDAHWDKMKQFNDIMQNSDTIVEDNKEHLKHLGETLGEDSEIYKFTADAVEGFNKKLGSSKAMVKAYDDAIKNLGTDLGALSLKNNQGMGLSDESYKELQEYVPALTEGYKTYYRALQVIHKQEDDFDKSDRTLISNMKERGAEEKDILNKREQHLEHYNNFIKHSAEHNTSDDWWGGTWSGILAWADSVQIWLDYKTEDLANWYHDFSKTWNNIPKELGEAWNNLNFPDIGKMFTDWIGDAHKSLDDSWRDLTEMFDHNIKEPVMNFLSFDWLPDVGGVGEFFANILGGIGESVQNFINDPLGSLGITLPDNWNILSLFGLNPVSASDGSSDHPSILEDLKQGFGVDIQAFIDGMSTDPLGTLGITGAITDITTFLSQLIPISFESVTGFVQNNLIIPFGQAVYNGIMSIPLVGDILSLFGLVNGDNSGASQKGNDLATSFKTKLEEVIRNIPILGDILQLLGIIPQANPTASSNGQGVGSSIKTGFKNGLTGMAQIIQDEINHILNALGDAINQAGQKALELGNAIVSGVRNAIDPGSPGIIAREIIGNEFGTYIPQVISNNSEMAYMSAQTYGQSVVDGISSVNFNSFGALATDYESDAQTMITTTQLLGLDTTMAFNDMALAVNTTTNTMGTNVIGTYNSMSTQQSSMLQNMKTQNMTAYNDMYQKSNQSLIQMRDSTSNLTAQMTNAWRHMKDQIVATANQLKSESTSHFNQLSNTIGEFYRKIQNPANWGAGSPDLKEGTRRPMVGRRIGKAIHHGAGGGNPIRPRGSSTMSIAQLKKAICPNGDCGSLFDGYSFTDKVDVESFLMSVMGEHGFGWNDWGGTHYNYIKTKSDDWDMKSPTINLVGGIPTNANYKVGDFENGSPKISFESFQSMAESIFSAIPYRFYYDSSWKGSWLGALQAGACNCWDGANALIAFANTCGFSGSIAHGSWNGIPHVWAVIEGRKMDTTGWQNRGTWTPSASAGSPMVRRPIHDGNMNQDTTPVHVEVNINGNVYGVDDLDSHISESIDKGLEKHFNKAYTIGV